MPGLDWIPGVSQFKSTIQFVTGDFEGAAETQKNFARECPGVSQVTSVGQLLVGDTEGALETQKRCFNAVNNTANATPIVGHVKGFALHLAGDSEGGNRVFRAANRTTLVIGVGGAAGVATGGLGAIPAGIAAAAGYDALATVGTGKPQGIAKVIGQPLNAGAIIDAAICPEEDD